MKSGINDRTPNHSFTLRAVSIRNAAMGMRQGWAVQHSSVQVSFCELKELQQSNPALPHGNALGRKNHLGPVHLKCRPLARSNWCIR